MSLIVSSAALGRALTMMIAVALERERSDIIDHFKKSVRREPVVMSANYVTGDTDIKGFKTDVVMDRINASFYIPPWKLRL